MLGPLASQPEKFIPGPIKVLGGCLIVFAIMIVSSPSSFITQSSSTLIDYVGERASAAKRWPFIAFNTYPRAASASLLVSQLLQPDDSEEIAVCTSIYNEGRFISEWILFHRLMGVDKFYLYDTGSTDNTQIMLQPWIDSGIVKLHRFREDQGGRFQVNSLEHCSRHYAGNTSWLLDCDVDEFYVPTAALTSVSHRTSPSVADYPSKPLRTILEKNPLYQEADAIAVSRVTWKNDGKALLAPGASVLEQQTLREMYHAQAFDKVLYTKSVVHTKKQVGWIIPGAHYIKHLTIENPNVITVTGMPVDIEMNDPTNPVPGWLYRGKVNKPTYEPLVLYHYIQRDLENCLTKLERAKTVRKGGWRDTYGEAGCRSFELYQATPGDVPIFEMAGFYGGAAKDLSMADAWYGQWLPDLIADVELRAQQRRGPLNPLIPVDVDWTWK